MIEKILYRQGLNLNIISVYWDTIIHYDQYIDRFDNEIVSVSNLGTSEQQAVFVLDKKGNLFKVEGAAPQNNVMEYQG